MANNTFTMAGVMGWPVSHSRSPVIHNHWIRHYGLQGAYGLFPVQPEKLEDAIRSLPALGLAGCNVTIPHKVNAMQFMDAVDPLARRMGALNTIVVSPEGALHGFNNDGFGYIQSLRDAKPDWYASAGPSTVLGGGGAARAVVLKPWRTNLAPKSMYSTGANATRPCAILRFWSIPPTRECMDNPHWKSNWTAYPQAHWYRTSFMFPWKALCSKQQSYAATPRSMAWVCCSTRRALHSKPGLASCPKSRKRCSKPSWGRFENTAWHNPQNFD